MPPLNRSDLRNAVPAAAGLTESLLIVGNWKFHKTIEQAKEFLAIFRVASDLEACVLALCSSTWP